MNDDDTGTWIIISLLLAIGIGSLVVFYSHSREIAAIANGEKRAIRIDTPKGPKYYVVPAVEEDAKK